MEEQTLGTTFRGLVYIKFPLRTVLGVNELEVAAADHSVVEPAILLWVNLSLPENLLVEAPKDWWQRLKASNASQRLAVLPLILTHDQQVVLLGPLPQQFLLLSPDLILHFCSRRQSDRAVENSQSIADLQREEREF